MQKSIDTPWGHKRAFPVFLLLLSPPLSLFRFSTTILSGTLQCALLSPRAIYSQVISLVSPPLLGLSEPSNKATTLKPLCLPHAFHTCSSSPSPEDPISPPAQNPLTRYKSCTLPNCQSPKRWKMRNCSNPRRLKKVLLKRMCAPALDLYHEKKKLWLKTALGSWQSWNTE